MFGDEGREAIHTIGKCGNVAYREKHNDVTATPAINPYFIDPTFARDTLRVFETDAVAAALV